MTIIIVISMRTFIKSNKNQARLINTPNRRLIKLIITLIEKRNVYKFEN